MAVIENEEQDPAAVHQLPRRVLVPDECAPAVKFCDYLFDADTIQDAVDNFSDILDLTVEPDCVDDSVECVMSESLLEKLDVRLPLLDAPPCRSSSACDRDVDLRYIEQLVGRSDDHDQRRVFAVVAAVVLLLAVILYFIFGRTH